MVEILGMDKAQFEEALTHQASDFEDMLQYICASTNMCDIIITRNIRDFSFSKLPLYTPSQYLSTQH
jgi:predicted nucleic acid-binding protein